MNPAEFAANSAQTLVLRKQIGRLRTELAWLDMQLVAAHQSLQRGARARIQRLVRNLIVDEEVLLCVKTDVLIPFAKAWGFVHPIKETLPEVPGGRYART